MQRCHIHTGRLERKIENEELCTKAGHCRSKPGPRLQSPNGFKPDLVLSSTKVQKGPAWLRLPEREKLSIHSQQVRAPPLRDQNSCIFL